MKLKLETKEILEKINFLGRYVDIYKSSLKSMDHPFESYSNDKAIQIFDNLGYRFRFYKTEKFFGLKESHNDYEFIFNISLRYGKLELIWGLKKSDQKIRLGGPWNVIVKLMGRSDLGIKKPAFSNYKELEDLLRQAFSLYEDFKKEVICSSIQP
jgi:hypothetical protein